MGVTGLAHLLQRLETLFPERHLYVRSNGQMRAFVLTTGKQAAAAGAVAAAALWTGVCTAAIAVNGVTGSAADREVARTEAKYERWIADRQARLDSAVARLDADSGAAAALADDVQRRHEALAQMLTSVKDPAAARALAQAAAPPASAPGETPLGRIQAVRVSQEQLLDAADAYAKTRADRLRLAFRMAGLNPGVYTAKGPLGGPLIEAKDPRALAAVLDVDPRFAERIQQAASGLSDAGALSRAAETLPLARPTAGTPQTSGFGVRFDPFTRRPAFHSGLDFAGRLATPVQATAPGVVSFTGQRSGYGNTIEIDHGRGFKTRYAHLQAIAVRPGQRIALGERIGAMGSTGRSTGVHLHYEVWVNGRAQNPSRYVKAGDYVQQAAS